MEPSLPQAPDKQTFQSDAVLWYEIPGLDPAYAHCKDASDVLAWLANNHAHLDDTQTELFTQASRLHRIADHVLEDAHAALLEALDSITSTRLKPRQIPDQPPYLGVDLLNQHSYLVLKQGDRMTGRIVGISATDPMNDDDETSPGVQYMVLEIPVNQP